MKGSHIESSVAERKSSEYARHESPPGTHSSGNCRRFSLHSLLISSGKTSVGEPLRVRRYEIYSNRQTPPQNRQYGHASKTCAPTFRNVGAQVYAISGQDYFTSAISSMQKYPGMSSPYSLLSLLSTENTRRSTGSAARATFTHADTLSPAASMSGTSRV